MNRTQPLFCLFLFCLLTACSDNTMSGPDAPVPPPDAGPPDAAVPDAAPGDAMAPPSDAEACRYLPDESTETTMPNYPLRFKTGQGLEESPDLRQEGLLELQNAEIGNRDVVELRRGALQLGDSRSTTPGDVVPDADRRAIWSRGNEVLLETQDSIYKQQKAITAFTWLRAAAWTRMRLREFYANTFAADVLSADYAVLGDATLVAYQITGGAARVALYGPSMALEADLNVGTARPRLSSEGDRLRVSSTFGGGAAIVQSGVYTTGSGSVTMAPVGLNLAVGRPFWDVTGQQVDNGDHVSGWIGTPTNATSSAVFAWDGATPGTATRALALNAAHAPVTDDCSITVFPVRTVDGQYRVAVAQVYLDNTNIRHRLYFEILNINPATAAITVVDTETVDLGAHPTIFARAVAMSWEDFATLWIAVELDNGNPGTMRSVRYYRHPNGGVPALMVTHENTAIVTQGAIMSGTPTNTLPAADLLSPGFGEMLLGANMVQRSGWVVFAPRTGEIVARSFVGFTGDVSTRAARPPKGSLIANGSDITWAGPASVPSDPASTTLRAIAICRLDRTARANKPAVLDGTAIGAHAGYPRAYDGTRAFEHDWHTLPRILGAGTVAGAGIAAGVYNFAATWEDDDANGLRYRSAPDFFLPLTVAAPVGSFNVDVEAMTHTERSGVKLVIWRTLANQAVYKRAGEFPVTGAFMTVNLTITDVTLATRETLDQAPVSGGANIVPSVPARATDFVALLIDRLASRDPRVGSLMTFTIPSREAAGFATHWFSDGVLQEPLERDVTSAIEMNGRIVVGSELGLAQLIQDGPDATGEGTFGLPLAMLAPIGIEDHASTERLPIGYGFSTADGPRLLTPGLTVQHIDEQVERHYTITGGHVVAIAWDALREEIIWLDEDADTLRLNPHSGRWASDTNRTGRDLAVTEDGTVYVLRSDGKVLEQSDDVFADGATAYALKVTSPHVREPARDGQAHGGFLFAGVEVFGEYVGPHALTVTVYLDFRDTPVIFQGTVPQANIVANAAAGRDYRYVLYTESRHCYACKVVVETSAAPNETVRIAGIDIRYNPDGSADPAQVAEEQRVPLTVSFLS